jgi:hypothetical protein
MRLKPIKFPTYNDKFKTLSGLQYFFQDNSKNIKYLISEELKNQEIEQGKNIFLSVCIDTEFTKYAGNPLTLTLKELEKNKNKFLLQKDVINTVLLKNNFYNVIDIAMGKIDETHMSFLDQFLYVKQKPYTHLTTQIKHIFYDDGSIIINPAIQKLYKKHVKDEDLQYPSVKKENGCHIIDHLQMQGFDVFLERKETHLNRKEFKDKYIKNDQVNYKTCTIKLYAFYLNADLNKIFEGKFKHDLLQAQSKGDIKLNRRITGKGMNPKWYPNWLITINGETFRVAIDFADLGALQGNISYANVLRNLDMDDTVKNSMDEFKTNMLYGLIYQPKDFKKYALDDLSVYDVYKKQCELIAKIYSTLNLDEYCKESKLTTGSTVNELQEAVLLNYLGLPDRKKLCRDELLSYTKIGSPKNLKSYMDLAFKVNEQGACLKRYKAAKTPGGRCFRNKQLILATSSTYTLCDIDISSAYTSIASALYYRFGCPVILNFTQYKVTLREFLKYYESMIDERGFKLIVETEKGKLLEFEQDLLVSFPNLRPDKKRIYDEQGELEGTMTSVNLNNMETAIYSQELLNTPISYDDLNIIRDGMSKKQSDDILDNAKMICAVFYPKKYECKTVAELREQIAKHNINGEGRFDDIMPHAHLDNEEGQYCHYYHKTNFGRLMMDQIIQFRRENKDINPSLAYLFKLIGNTIYGNNVSPHFDISNIVFASNITAMCRAGMWCVEKGLDIHQTITDGGVFELNEVIHRMREGLDTPLLVRGYLQCKGEMSRYKKWKIKPITEKKEEITYKDGKGWTIEGILYPYNKEKLIKVETVYKKLVSELGNKHQDTKEAKDLYDKEMVGLKSFLSKINELVIAHIKNTFPKVELFNGTFNKCKTDKKGIVIKDFKGDYVYENFTGLFEFEVKNMCSYAVFHGSADYMYENTSNEETIKMRGYENTKEIISAYLENGQIFFDEDYYSRIFPVKKFLTNLKDKPESVAIPRPYIKSCLLKPAEYKKNYKNIWQHSSCEPGADYYKVVTIPIYSLRHKFISHTQHVAWIKYQNELKRKYGGLSFEVYYINHDGTINYKKMVEEIDKYIRDGVMKPSKVFDKDRNFQRDITLEKNKIKSDTILNHIVLTNTMKNICRIMTIGVHQYIIENARKVKEDGTIIMRKIPKYISTEHHDHYENVYKYSNDNEYRDVELRFAI